MTNSQAHDMKEFGLRLAQERRKKGLAEQRDLTRRDVARVIGVAESTFGRWEMGEAMPREREFAELAAYYGVTRAWLRYGVEPREAEPPKMRRAIVETPRETQVTRRGGNGGKKAG